MLNRVALSIVFVLVSLHGAGAAEWTLDPGRSNLSFVSIKAGNIAEPHGFRKLSGEIAGDGSARLEIELASVDTMIPIRDDRMRSMLFETELFPTATVDVRVEQAALDDLSIGEGTPASIEGSLTLRGRTSPVTASVVALLLDEDTLLVTTLQPILLNADALGLAPGLEKLREVAGLPGISMAVPVTFMLTYQRTHAAAPAP